MRAFVSTLIAGLLLCGGTFVRAEDAPAPPGTPPAAASKPWKNETELSVVSANGNTRSTTYSGKNDFSYTLSKTTLELTGGALGASNQGTPTAEKYFAGEKISYKLSDRNYAFEIYRWDKDRFAKIHDRHDVNGGLGREMIKTEHDSLITELGAGWTKEDRIGSPNTDFGTGRAYMKFEHVLSPTANFQQDAEYIENFKNSDDFRVKTETAIIAALSTHFSLKTAYRWQHVGAPPAGTGRNDTLTTVALIATY